MGIKRTIYVALFAFLGALLGFLAHGVMEILVIQLLVKDFATYGLGLSWKQWYMIHHIGTIVLFAGGLYLGLRQGKYWWRIIYIEKRLRK